MDSNFLQQSLLKIGIQREVPHHFLCCFPAMKTVTDVFDFFSNLKTDVLDRKSKRNRFSCRSFLLIIFPVDSQTLVALINGCKTNFRRFVCMALGAYFFPFWLGEQLHIRLWVSPCLV